MNYETIIEVAQDPSNFGTILDADVSHQDSNPLCGDSIGIDAKIHESRISEIKFSGQGCTICMASASTLTEAVKGKTIEDAGLINKDFILEKLDIKEISVVRVKCAELSINVLSALLKKVK